MENIEYCCDIKNLSLPRRIYQVYSFKANTPLGFTFLFGKKSKQKKTMQGKDIFNEKRPPREFHLTTGFSLIANSFNYAVIFAMSE